MIPPSDTPRRPTVRATTGAILTRAFLYTFLLLPLPQLSAQPAPAIKKLPPAEEAALEARLDHGLLPPGATELEFQPDQAVILAGSLRLLPVRYQSSPAAAGNPPHFQCGLFLAAENQPDRFLPTFGTAWTAAESCDGLDAAGLIPVPLPAPTTSPTGSQPTSSSVTSSPAKNTPALTTQAAAPAYPTILLIYQAFTTPASFPEPVLLLWDEPTATYRPDPELSRWLALQKDGRTIPGARRLLATHTH